MAWIVLVILMVCGAGIVLLERPDELIGLADPQLAHSMKAGAMIVSIGGCLFVGHGARTSLVLKQAATWSAVFLAVVSLYAYRGQILDTGLSMLDTGANETAEAAVRDEDERRSTHSQRRVVSITAEDSGHFSVEALINGTHVSMLADTGATLVTLTHDDALRSGINIFALDYDVSLQTANGTTMAAYVELDEVDVGGIVVRDVPAVISQEGALHVSLLGMTYFREIGTFELSGDRLILRE